MSIVRRIFLGFVVPALTVAAQTTAPASAPATAGAKESAVFGEWSAVVNGLQARVAALGYGRGYTDGVFLELRNAGEKPLIIPSLAISATGNDFPWHLQVGQGRDWKDSPWGQHEPNAFGSIGGWSFGDWFDPPKPRTEPAVILQPRETALMQINGRLDDAMRHAQRYRMILQQSGDGPVAGWSGTLETPPAPTHPSEKAVVALAGTLSAPTYLPPLDRVPAYFPNGSGLESPFAHVWASNRRLFRQLALYQDAPIARELGKRLTVESDFTMQLLLAEEAGVRGSAAGKEFILTAMKDVDYVRCRSTLDALRYLAESDKTPDWAFDAMIAALKDQRQVTNPISDWGDGTPVTVSYLADEDSWLALRLGDKKCRRAVPALIELVKNGNHRRCVIRALGKIGDPAAVPALFEIIKNERANLNIWSGMLGPETYVDALGALVSLKADGIEEELLANVVHPDVVEMLERMGDARAIPVLRQVVSTGKPKQIKGSDAQSDSHSVAAARIALATLEPGDPVSRYCSLVQDQSLSEFSRREAVWRLGEMRPVDSSAIPALLAAAREDPSGTVVDNAIIVLGEYHHGAAVNGLIDLFGVDYEGKQNWKYAYEPEMFREHIAASLERITGQSFGANPAAWQKWWASQDQSAFR